MIAVPLRSTCISSVSPFQEEEKKSMAIRGIFLIFSPTKGVEQLECVWVGLNRCEGGLVTIKVQFRWIIRASKILMSSENGAERGP